MTCKTLGRVAFVIVMIGVSAASAPGVQLVSAAPTAGSSAGAPHTARSQQPVAVARSGEAGRGWGSMLACSACVIGAGVVIAGGPGAILLAVNTPGSAVAVLACASSCYDAFQ
jgi:hypothetical protein